MKKKDVILIGILLLVAFASYLGIQKWQGGRTAVVTKPAAESNEEKTAAVSETQAATEVVTEAKVEGTTEEATEEATTEVLTLETQEAVSEAAVQQETEGGDEAALVNPDAARFGIRIYAQGEELGVYSLADDQVIDIGGTNTVEIKDGGATMIDAQCPDQLCRYMGTITDAYGLIVCLPNGVIVEGVNLAPQPEDVEIDGIS